LDVVHVEELLDVHCDSDGSRWLQPRRTTSTWIRGLLRERLRVQSREACYQGRRNYCAELGNSGQYIFGRIEPKKGIPPHPDHAPGFFVIDSDTDKVTTGLDRDKWLTELKAVGVDSPQLQPPEFKSPKKY